MVVVVVSLLLLLVLVLLLPPPPPTFVLCSLFALKSLFLCGGHLFLPWEATGALQQRLAARGVGERLGQRGWARVKKVPPSATLLQC